MLDADRFLQAQAPVYAQVPAELRAGRKRSHWMWFIFPQLAGLGKSSMAAHYALQDLRQARAYLEHPVLGARLVECTRLALAQEKVGLQVLFGSPDNMKFRSCMTLFELAKPDEACFTEALDRLCARQRDQRTLKLLDDAG